MALKQSEVRYVTVLWDGQPRAIEADATDSTLLVGMLLLHGHSFNIEVKSGDPAVIEARA